MPPEAVKSSPNIIPIRQRCNQCKRWYLRKEVMYGICWGCLNRRAKASLKPEFDSEGGKSYRCSECPHRFIGRELGVLSWDYTSNTFLLLCLDCADKKVRTDDLYKDTPFRHAYEAQH